jgi:cell fate regulator YaaT (PSP1 superfamily)
VSIFPLPVFEADRDPTHRTELTDAEAYERLKPPTSIVVRVGRMRFVAEYAYRGDAKPGCGSKLVARTHRGTEIVEMLTTTCSNSGCSKSVSRQEMLDYIEESGGREYPFHTDGQILRVAAIEDLNRWSEVQSRTAARVKDVKRIVEESGLPMKVVDVEPILGQELLTVYFLSEERVDFRELVRQLAGEFHSRIEMRQVGARDEARLVADYERCGQHCCCKNFLKVLKPISMRSAKIQKATLDPLKISGRCGRLMCCLRYEDQTYEDLKQRLPRNKSRVGTSEGPGIVIDGKILVQLVLVQLEHDGREIAVPVEELMDPETCPKPNSTTAEKATQPDALRGLSPEEASRKVGDRDRRERGQRSRGEQQDRFRAKAAQRPGSDDPVGETGHKESQADELAAEPAPTESARAGESGEEAGSVASKETDERRRRRRRRRRGGRGETDNSRPSAELDGTSAPETGKEPRAAGAGTDNPARTERQSSGKGIRSADGAEQPSEIPESGDSGELAGRARRRRRRRRRRGGGGNEGGADGPDAPESGPAT